MLKIDIDEIDRTDCGNQIHQLIQELFPICRSITGDGVRETLSIIKKHISLDICEVPTGTQAFDWVVPQEWNIKDAYIIGPNGEKILDFKNSNLHVVNYSTAINQTMSLDELKGHIHTLPDAPDWIPYRTSYYNPGWGFCMTHKQFLMLEDGNYEVVIDSEHSDGSLTYGEFFIPGSTKDEILIFSHCCHPSLCNDNLSGVAIATFLANLMQTKESRYSYRFVFSPASIGSITWMSENEHKLANIKHGLVIAVAGDNGHMTYKKTKAENAELDIAVQVVLQQKGLEFDILDFSPWGYDERQFNSPGINLSVGRLTRTPNGCFPEYHTSADNLDFVKANALADSYATYLDVFNVLDNNYTFINQSPKCEPQLGKRGLYRKTGGHKDVGKRELAMLWVMNMSDGSQSLLDIADKSKLDFDVLVRAAADLLDCDLLAIA